MKKFILILFLALISIFSSKAFHYHGSEITCEQINGLTYKVTFKLYGDIMSSWQWTNNEILNIINISYNVDFNLNMIIIDTLELHNGVSGFVYSGVVTFPTIGEYTISYSGCCRVWSVNAWGSDAQTYYNHSIIMVDSVSGNSSPEFLYDPIVLAPANDTLFYNPLPYDADGDILLWSIDTPRMYDNEALLNYLTPSGTAGSNFSINPKTGEITWIPVTIGNYITAVKVEEYRNGIKIGEIIRDMVFVVEPKQGNITRANIDANTWSTDQYGNFIFYLTYNIPFNLVVITNDPDGDTLEVEAKGHPFLLNNNPATFLSSSGTGFSSGLFSWTPTFADINIDPYLVVFRIYEHAITDLVLRDKTIQLVVGNFTSVNENNYVSSVANIYPNPSSGELFIPVNVEKSADSKIIIIDNLGQQVKELDQKLNAGQNLIYFDNLKLPAGIYFLNLLINKNESVTKKLVIH